MDSQIALRSPPSPSSAADGTPAVASSSHAAGAAAPAGCSGVCPLSLSVAVCVVCATDVRRPAPRRGGFSLESVVDTALLCTGPVCCARLSCRLTVCMLGGSCAADHVHDSLHADVRQIGWCLIRPRGPSPRCSPLSKHCTRQRRANSSSSSRVCTGPPIGPPSHLTPLACLSMCCASSVRTTAVIPWTVIRTRVTATTVQCPWDTQADPRRGCSIPIIPFRQMDDWCN